MPRSQDNNRNNGSASPLPRGLRPAFPRLLHKRCDPGRIFGGHLWAARCTIGFPRGTVIGAIGFRKRRADILTRGLSRNGHDRILKGDKATEHPSAREARTAIWMIIAKPKDSPPAEGCCLPHPQCPLKGLTSSGASQARHGSTKSAAIR